MPNRILKESICTSDNIDALSVEAECFFYRLLVQCDDYGRYDARPSVLRSRCFPLRVDRVKDATIGAWLRELVSARLIWLYTSDGRQFLQVTTWEHHQQIRAKRSKFPQPPADAGNLKSSDINFNQEISDDSICPRNPIQSESNPIRESNPNPNDGADAPTPKKAAKQADWTPGQRLFLERWNAKRLNPEQAAAIASLETVYGMDLLTECVTWARTNDMALGRAISSIKTAIKGWGSKKPARANGSAPASRMSAMVEAVQILEAEERANGHTS